MIKLESASFLFENQPIYQLSGAASNFTAMGKRVVVVYEYVTPELPVALQTMLEKLVQACKYKPEEVAYLNAGNFTGGLTLATLKSDLAIEVVLVFGDLNLSRNLPALKRNIPYQLNGLKVVRAEALDKLDGNDKEKKALWAGLQKMLAL